MHIYISEILFASGIRLAIQDPAKKLEVWGALYRRGQKSQCPHKKMSQMQEAAFALYKLGNALAFEKRKPKKLLTMHMWWMGLEFMMQA